MISLVLLLGAPDAHAFKFRAPALKWSNEQLPLTVYSSAYLEDSLPQTLDEETGRYPQEDLFIKSLCNWHWTDYCEEMLSADWQQYDDATCADIPFEYGGQVSNHTGAANDGVFVLYWDDPADELATGVNGVSSAWPSGDYIDVIAGEQVQSFGGCDITMNNDIVWGLTNDMEENCPSGTMSAESTLTHESGHCLGLGHSCDDGELCTESELLNATMYWSGGPCDTSRASIGADDVSGVTALYGPYLTWSVTDESVRFGPAPLEICFQVDAETEYLDQVQTIEWNFGDGNTSTELEPCHSYETQGQFSVTATVNGLSDSCGEWEVAQTQRAHVLVCEEPIPDFDLQHDDGLTYQLVNATDVSTYGCVDGLIWEIFQGNSADGEPIDTFSAWSPKVEFDAEGTYTIRLTAQGPAGESSIDNTFEVEELRGEGAGCSSTGSNPQGLLFGLAGLAVAFVFGRRRRR
ncbi:MAG: PKD domain-containing protein [Myxococcota bacterium]|nr:PKD domain-containing protein [Myxococcota bacterium]